MIRCPIINQEMDEGTCVAIVDISEECTKDTMLPESIKKVKGWRDICKGCKNHNN